MYLRLSNRLKNESRVGTLTHWSLMYNRKSQAWKQSKFRIQNVSCAFDLNCWARLHYGNTKCFCSNRFHLKSVKMTSHSNLGFCWPPALSLPLAICTSSMGLDFLNPMLKHITLCNPITRKRDACSHQGSTPLSLIFLPILSVSLLHTKLWCIACLS